MLGDKDSGLMCFSGVVKGREDLDFCFGAVRDLI